MLGDNVHSKLLAKAGTEILKPLGLFQKGRSRAWIDDHGWWLGLVEFQPFFLVKGQLPQRRRDVALVREELFRP